MTQRLSEAFIESLPTPEAARTFMARLFEKHPDMIPLCRAQPALLAHLLVLATYSPYLGEVLIAHPEYIRWFATEDLSRLKPKEELLSDLARFAAMHGDLDFSRVLVRFKQRELLRIYARDCLGLATLAETMRELSDLADVILQYALWRIWQELVEQYGRPEIADARGRLHEAEFAIVALGKLGSQELNYASDIDLFYLCSGDGMTSSHQVTTKEFFTKLAERITRIISGIGPEGAVYRVDLRLRPRGRDGDLVATLGEAVAYYRTEARQWERQTLIRARAAAGSEALVRDFLARVGEVLYRPEPLAEILDEIRASKERLDQERSTATGVDIKLGRGGIREIEFIVQALQLYHGGRDPWVRHPQILIGAQRLADKGGVTDQERAHLTEAYIFLRTLEHRLQMEHGVRTHVVPLEGERLQRLARRMGYAESHGLLQDLERHRQRVAAIFERVFHEKTPLGRTRPRVPSPMEGDAPEVLADVLCRELARAFPCSDARWAEARPLVLEGLNRALNPKRAAVNFRTWIGEWMFSRSTRASEQIEAAHAIEAELPALVRFFGASDFLAQLVIRRPERLWRLLRASELMAGSRAEYARRLRAAITQEDPTGSPRDLRMGHPTRSSDRVGTTVTWSARRGSEEDTLARAMNALRRAWAEEVLCIGYGDVLGHVALRRVNELQTDLASASLEVASELALERLAARYGRSDAPAVFTILGLGRLGHMGVDYGSDLDIIVVYEDRAPSPLPMLSASEAYGRLVEMIIHILSTITHEGYLYRVDLRLRPGGNASPPAHSRSSFTDYLRTKASTWERLAYLKAFPIVGDPHFGQQLYEELQDVLLHARLSDPAMLASDVREMRDRIERENARPTSSRNFKFGRGGMMDVYFATRYLQLKHCIPEPEQRGTIPLIAYLHERGVLTSAHYESLAAGYHFLRQLDHALRVLFGRPVHALPTRRATLEEIATWLGRSSPDDLEREHEEHRRRIRAACEEIVR